MRNRPFLQAVYRPGFLAAERGEGRFPSVYREIFNVACWFRTLWHPPLCPSLLLVEMNPAFVVLSTVYNSKNVSADQARCALTVDFSTW